MPLEQLLFLNLGTVVGALVIVWCVSLRIRNASIVDVFWGCGFVLVAWMSIWLAGNPNLKKVLIVTLVSVWGLRLAAY